MSYSKYLKEIEIEFLKLGKPYSKEQQKKFSDTYFKGTKYLLHNVKNSEYQKLLKYPFSFKDLKQREIAKIWSYVFKNTTYMGVGSLAIDYFKQFQNKKTYLLTQDWSILKSWAPKIENWVHGDMLCGLYCQILSESPRLVYPELQKWSSSKSPWKNRLAVLSLLYYYNPKKNLLSYSKYISIIKPHITKDHYYLQKAVGWSLRELQKPYPKKSWKFISQNCTVFSSTAFTTIVENTPASKKNVLKEKRKLHRKKLRAQKKK